jgi:threonine/homoserine/homoserine lactone efflux protein
MFGGSNFFVPTATLALISFSFVSSVTPGPNNIMLTASGVNFGLRRTVPHMAGIFVGCAMIILLTSFGLGFLVQQVPLLRWAMMALGAIYTLWLSWKIASSGSLGADGGRPHPMHFWGAVAFQWVNPKLWVMAVAAAALYVRPDHLVPDGLLLSLVFSLVTIPCILLWAGFGAALSDFLKAPARIRVFNMVMGLCLAASVLFLLRM